MILLVIVFSSYGCPSERYPEVVSIPNIQAAVCDPHGMSLHSSMGVDVRATHACHRNMHSDQENRLV